VDTSSASSSWPRVAGCERRPASDLPIAIELARRAALAIDNGRPFMELHDAIRAKDDFLAVLSHALRTPLTPVLAAVSAALARGAPTGGESVAMLEMIERNIELERRLIDDLLDLSRVTRGKLELSLQVVDLHRLVDHAVKICRHDADAQAIALSVELGAERHHVDGDPARIEQIVWNLVKNAIKYTERGGKAGLRRWRQRRRTGSPASLSPGQRPVERAHGRLREAFGRGR
jgi:signal transduction histidine kinase